MAEITDTISEVETKTLPTGTTIYLLKDSEGKEYSTRDREIAKEAYGIAGTAQTAHIEYTEKKGGQHGQFVNRYLNSFTISSGEFTAPKKTQEPPPGLFEDTEPEPVIGIDREAEKKLAIDKAVALKAAVDLMEWFEPADRTSTNVTGVAEYFTVWLQEFRP